MLASVVSFAEGRRQFPVFVPKHSAAGLDATHVVRLAQLRGSRALGTNNRLRDLPRQDSTGLVGVGSGTLTAPSASHMAPLSDALAAFAKVWRRGRAVRCGVVRGAVRGVRCACA